MKNLSAGDSIITIPVLILYLSLQRAFITSIATTGIKG